MQFLSDNIYIGRIVDAEPRCAQMQAVGIGTQIAGGILAALVGEFLYGIHLLVEGFLSTVVLGVGERVPSPVAHGSQGHTVGIVLRKSLQARGICRKGKAAVAYGERLQRVDGYNVRVITAHHALAVDTRKDRKADEGQ